MEFPIVAIAYRPTNNGDAIIAAVIITNEAEHETLINSYSNPKTKFKYRLLTDSENKHFLKGVRIDHGDNPIIPYPENDSEKLNALIEEMYKRQNDRFLDNIIEYLGWKVNDNEQLRLKILLMECEDVENKRFGNSNNFTFKLKDKARLGIYDLGSYAKWKESLSSKKSHISPTEPYMNQEKAIELLKSQQQKLESLDEKNYLGWQTQTKSFIKDFFGEQSQEYQDIKDFSFTSWYSDLPTNDQIKREIPTMSATLDSLIETITHKGLYKQSGEEAYKSIYYIDSSIKTGDIGGDFAHRSLLDKSLKAEYNNTPEAKKSKITVESILKFIAAIITATLAVLKGCSVI